MRATTVRSLTLGVVLSVAAAGQAAVVWNETSNGDLSGNRLAPTALPLVIGSNDVIGSVQGGELDYITFTVPAQVQFTKLALVSYVSSDSRGFIGMQKGTVFTEDPATPNVANLLGWAHFGTGPGNVGTDILDDMGVAPGAQGFVPPLPAGQYTFWIQQIGALTSYDFNFVLVSVPEPSSLASSVLAALALLWHCAARRCRRV